MLTIKTQSLLDYPNKINSRNDHDNNNLDFDQVKPLPPSIGFPVPQPMSVPIPQPMSVPIPQPMSVPIPQPMSVPILETPTPMIGFTMDPSSTVYNPYVQYSPMGFVCNLLVQKDTSIPSPHPSTLTTDGVSILSTTQVLPPINPNVLDTTPPSTSSTLVIPSLNAEIDELKISKKRKLSSTLYSTASTPDRHQTDNQAQQVIPSTETYDQYLEIDGFQDQELQSSILPMSNRLSQSAIDRKEAQRQRNRLSAQQHRERQKKLMQDLRSELQTNKQLNQELEWKIKQIETEKSKLIIENLRLNNYISNLELKVEKSLKNVNLYDQPGIAPSSALGSFSVLSSLPLCPTSITKDESVNWGNDRVAIGVCTERDDPYMVMGYNSPFSDLSCSTTDSVVNDDGIHTIDSDDSLSQSPSSIKSKYDCPTFHNSTSSWMPITTNEYIQTAANREQLTIHHPEQYYNTSDGNYEPLDIVDERQGLFPSLGHSPNVLWSTPQSPSFNGFPSSLATCNVTPPCLLPNLISPPPFAPQSPSSDTILEPSPSNPHHLDFHSNHHQSYHKSDASTLGQEVTLGQEATLGQGLTLGQGITLGQGVTLGQEATLGQGATYRKHRRANGGTSLVSWSNPKNMLLFIVALITLVFYPLQEPHYSKSSLSSIGLLPAPVDAAPQGRELVVYASERSLIPIDYFKHRSGPSVSIQYNRANVSSENLNISENSDAHFTHGIKTYDSSSDVFLSPPSLANPDQSQTPSPFPFKFLCPKPTFIVGTSEDLDSYLSTLASQVPPPPFKLVLTVPSSAFKSTQFPRRPRLSHPEFVHQLNLQSDLKKKDLKNHDIEEIKSPTSETDNLVWETHLRNHARKTLEHFSERLVVRDQANDSYGSIPPHRWTTGYDFFHEPSQYPALEEIPLHIVCDDIKWDLVDLNVRRLRHRQQ